MMNNRKVKILIFPALISITFAGCGKSDPEARTYYEVTLRAQPPAPEPADPATPVDGASAPGMTGSVPTADVGLSWLAPDGWEEKPGSGMRLVTFIAGGIECTISSFPGDVGGLRANVDRWLGPGQLDANKTVEEISAFISAADSLSTRGGLSGVFLDFTRLTGDGKSMLAAVLKKGDASVFVKLMGPGEVLDRERGKFLELAESLE
jgi:hypothetical protein